MKKNIINIAVISTLLLLTGCQTVPESNEENAVSKKDIKIPSIGKVQSIQNGQSLYVQLEYLGSMIYRPTESRKITLPRVFGDMELQITPANVFIHGKTKNDAQILCSVDNVAIHKFNKLPVCLMNEGAGKLNKLTVNAGIAKENFILEKPPTFVESEIVFNPSGPTKRELVFEKYNNKNLSLLYKEYSDNKLTLNQPLLILIESFPATINIKQADITFNGYSDGKIDYMVQKEMPATITGKEKVQCVTPGYTIGFTSTLEWCAKQKMVAFPLDFH